MTTRHIAEPSPTWGRDIALLKTVYAQLEEGRGTGMDRLVDLTEESRDSIWAIIQLWIKDGALSDAGIMSGSGSKGRDVTIVQNARTPRGMRLVGSWPSESDLPELLIKAVQDAADASNDQSVRDILREILTKWTGPDGVKTLIEMAAALARQGWLG